jgi:hypothetical protein
MKYTIELADKETYEELRKLLDDEITAIEYSINHEHDEDLAPRLARMVTLKNTLTKAEPIYQHIIDKIAEYLSGHDGLFQMIEEIKEVADDCYWKDATDEELRAALKDFSEGYGQNHDEVDPDAPKEDATRDELIEYVVANTYFYIAG